MKKYHKTQLIIAALVFAISVLTQCASQRNASNSTEDNNKGVPEYVLQKSGAQLWAESCIRCHNTASPATFSDVQWEVAIKHMEIRAQLTPIEAKKVLEFMQAAN